jgi:CheY-like chemotaxis protein
MFRFRACPIIDVVAGSPTKSPPVVLVVEDDPLLRMLAAEVAEEAGYLAIEAADADEAITLLEFRSDIALLLTDIDMPGSMNGLKLAQAVRNRWPSIKILVVSARVRPGPYELPLDSCFLAKPYRKAALVGELRELAASLGRSRREPGRVSTELFCSDVSPILV